jgi:hypothetical protein
MNLTKRDGYGMMQSTMEQNQSQVEQVVHLEHNDIAFAMDAASHAQETVTRKVPRIRRLIWGSQPVTFQFAYPREVVVENIRSTTVDTEPGEPVPISVHDAQVVSQGLLYISSIGLRERRRITDIFGHEADELRERLQDQIAALQPTEEDS